MVAPEPLTPFTRSVVRDVGRSYELGRLTWWPSPRYEASNERIPDVSDVVEASARTTRDGRSFLSWTRFPFADTAAANPGFVRLDDLRYAGPGHRSFASVMVPISAPPPSQD